MKRIAAILLASTCAAQAQTISGGSTSPLYLDSSAYPATMVFGGASDAGKCLGLTIGVVSYLLTPLTCAGGGGGGSPGGSNGMIQWNNAGSFGGIAAATSDGTGLFVQHSNLIMGTVGGTANLVLTTPNAGVSTQTITFPETTGTIGMLNLSQKWTGQNVFTDVTKINLNTLPSGLPFPLTGSVLVLSNTDSDPVRIELDSYGSNTFFSGRRANGTSAAPTALVAGDLVTNINALGYDGSAYTTVSSGSYRIYSAGTWSGSSTPTYLDFYTTATGSTTSASRMHVEQSGGVTLPPTVTGGDPGAGGINAALIQQGGVALGSNAFTSTAYATAARNITTTAPLAGGGNLTADRTLSITGAAGQVLAGVGPAFTSTPTLGASGTLGSLTFGNATSGTITLQPTTGALGTVTLSLPAVTDTIAVLGTTGQTFSATQIFSAAGSSSVPTIALSAAGSNCGFYSSAANKFDFACNGVAKVWDYNDTNAGNVSINTTALFVNGNVNANGSTIGFNNKANSNFSSPTNGNMQIGGVDSASPGTTNMLRFQGASAGNSNVSPSNVTIQGPLSTGNGSSDLVISTTNSSAGATSQNTATAALTLKGGTHKAVFGVDAQSPAFVAIGSAPTASGTCPVTTQVGGNTAGTFTMNGACVAGTVILTFAYTAPNGWACATTDQTTVADTLPQTASTTTTTTFTGTTANSDVISFRCTAF